MHVQPSHAPARSTVISSPSLCHQKATRILPVPVLFVTGLNFTSWGLSGIHLMLPHIHTPLIAHSPPREPWPEINTLQKGSQLNASKQEELLCHLKCRQAPRGLMRLQQNP